MKRNLCYVLLIVCCVTLFGGCGLKQTESNTENLETEENISEQESTAGKEQEVDEVNSEVSDEQQDEYSHGKKIEEQSFDVTLAPFGEVTFASYNPDRSTNQLADAVFLIEKGDDILCKLPAVEGWGAFYEVEAVSFLDYNKDGYDDIVLITSYLFGAGPQGAIPRSMIRYYKGSESGEFSYEEQMSEDATFALAEITIQTAKKFIGYADNSNEVVGIEGNSEEILIGYDSSGVGQYVEEKEFLREHGFEEAEPFYQYDVMTGEPQVVLYFDEKTGKGCGFVCETYYSSQREKWVEKKGFEFDSVETEIWKKPNPYRLAVDERVSDSPDNGENYVLNYKEEFTYTEDGKLDSFCSKGIWEEYEEEVEILQLDYTYRDDGTLCYREYGHNPFFFMTFLQSYVSYYDEQERLIYERGYITHGTYAFHYFYLDEDDKPEFCLELDYNLGYLDPRMVVYQ